MWPLEWDGGRVDSKNNKEISCRGAMCRRGKTKGYVAHRLFEGSLFPARRLFGFLAFRFFSFSVKQPVRARLTVITQSLRIS